MNYLWLVLVFNEVDITIPDFVIDTTNIETPLRTSQLLITTPANAYVFSQGFDTYEDFFRAYPFIKVQNDTIYFRGKTNVLLLKDGLPIHSLKEICFPVIDRIEVTGENSIVYGNYDGVVHIVTKKSCSNKPYSNFKVLKNPDKIQFEFGRAVGTCLFPKAFGMAVSLLDIYLGGDLGEDTSHISCNVGYKTKDVELRSYYEHYNKEISFNGALFSMFRFSVKKDFYNVMQEFNFQNHYFLTGIENSATGQACLFIRDCWEIKPLLYIVPCVRQNVGVQYIEPLLKVSVGYTPTLNTTIFGSVSEKEINTGIRYHESAINLFRKENDTGSPDNGAELRIISPWIYNLKIGGAIEAKWEPGIKITDNKTVFVEYKQSLKDKKLNWYIVGDIKNEFVRVELQIIDVKIFYRVSSQQPTYGLLWEFWN